MMSKFKIKFNKIKWFLRDLKNKLFYRKIKIDLDFPSSLTSENEVFINFQIGESVKIQQDHLQNKIYIGNYSIIKSKNLFNVKIFTVKKLSQKTICFEDCEYLEKCSGSLINKYKIKNNQLIVYYGKE
jgi:hypothetical protein